MGQLWDTVSPYLAAVLPTIGVGFLFYYVMKYLLEGDRRERLAQSQWDAAHRGAAPDRDAPGATRPAGSSPHDPDNGPAAR